MTMLACVNFNQPLTTIEDTIDHYFIMYRLPINNTIHVYIVTWTHLLVAKSLPVVYMYMYIICIVLADAQLGI